MVKRHFFVCNVCGDDSIKTKKNFIGVVKHGSKRFACDPDLTEKGHLCEDCYKGVQKGGEE